jgi:adenylosuccinate synthase
MGVDVLLGLQWGDEGKGKIVDVLAPQYDVVARFQGGPNAGHTLVFDDKKVVLHTVPSGIFHDRPANVIGNGVVIDPVTLQKEIAIVSGHGIDVKKKLFIAKKAHLILPTHRLLDAASEAAKGKNKIGSTLRGIGPAYMDKTGRNGLRIGNILHPDFKKKYKQLVDKHKQLLDMYKYDYDLSDMEDEWFEGIEKIRSLQIIDGEFYINERINEGKNILAEGAQGSMLDIDFGTYPFVTSSNTITAGVLTGLGIAPARINEVIGITKAYCTRVGSGPFPTELFDDDGQKLRDIGHEYGATTSRPRRCGWIDLVALNYTIMLNGVTQLAITKIDVLNEFERIKAGTGYDINGRFCENWIFDIDNEKVEPVYEDFTGWHCEVEDDEQLFPVRFNDYLQFLEKNLQVPIRMISTGPERHKLVKTNLSISQ